MQVWSCGPVVSPWAIPSALVGDRSICGNLMVSGQVSCGSLSSNGPVVVHDLVNITGALNVDGNINAAGNIVGPAVGISVLGVDVGDNGINSNGVLIVNNNAFADSWQINSDRRFKSNINDFNISDALGSLNKLRLVSYNLSGGSHRHGLIADEVEEVIPQAVGVNNGLKTIDLMVLIDFLIAANKEIAYRLEALESRANV